ncbi:membrane protein, partial [Candidatus Thiomargarita nelsonii]
MFEAHIISLLVTLLTESMGMLIFSIAAGGIKCARSRNDIQKNVITALVVNVVTHTVFWYTLPLIKLDHVIRLYGYETLIVIIEGLAYRILCKIPLSNAIALSFLLNLVSFLIGIS